MPLNDTLNACDNVLLLLCKTVPDKVLLAWNDALPLLLDTDTPLSADTDRDEGGFGSSGE